MKSFLISFNKKIIKELQKKFFKVLNSQEDFELSLLIFLVDKLVGEYFKNAFGFGKFLNFLYFYKWMILAAFKIIKSDFEILIKKQSENKINQEITDFEFQTNKILRVKNKKENNLNNLFAKTETENKELKELENENFLLIEKIKNSERKNELQRITIEQMKAKLKIENRKSTFC